jgi:DeoR family transcriptional regulator, fructose operon transcriptional repressor
LRPVTRQKYILNLANVLRKEWRVKELADRLFVSELTIRRDLGKLVEKGDVIRTLGGCIARGEGSIGTVFNNEYQRNLEFKTAIGREAAKLLKSDNTMLMGDGSTVLQFAAHLGGINNLKIYTNNIAAIQQLNKSGDKRLFILGGEYDYEYNMLLLKGSLTDRVLETLKFDSIFIGTDAIDGKGQCLSRHEELARTNQIILRRGTKKVLLADHTKVGAPGNVIYGCLSDFDLWVTTEGIDREKMEIYRQQTEIMEIPPSQSLLES